MKTILKSLLVLFVMAMGVLACEDNSEDILPVNLEMYKESSNEFLGNMRFDTDPGEDPGGGGSDTTVVRN